jgi:hypothetical protein
MVGVERFVRFSVDGAVNAMSLQYTRQRLHYL